MPTALTFTNSGPKRETIAFILTRNQSTVVGIEQRLEISSYPAATHHSEWPYNDPLILTMISTFNINL